MNRSVRNFIVKDNDIIRLSQAKMDAFYLKRKEVLPEHAGEVLNIASVFVELYYRKPVRILQIDCIRAKVDEVGALDASYQQEFRKRIGYVMDPPRQKVVNGVVDASSLFDARRLESKYRWRMSGEMSVRIAEILNIQ